MWILDVDTTLNKAHARVTYMFVETNLILEVQLLNRCNCVSPVHENLTQQLNKSPFI